VTELNLALKTRRMLASGSFQEVINACENQALTNEVLPTLVGAFCFLGRPKDAESLIQSSTLAETHKCECLFYLSLAWGRAGNQKESLLCLRKILKIAKTKKIKATFPEIQKMRFCFFQGLSFHFYLNARFKFSLNCSQRSWASSQHLADPFFKMIATDLKGHCLTITGSVSKGLAELKQAALYADEIGNGANLLSIRQSILFYKAQFGICTNAEVLQSQKQSVGAQLETELLNTLDLVQKSNHWTHFFFFFELSRQYCLQGDMRRAIQNLNKAESIALETQNTRYLAQVGHRKIYFSFVSRGDVPSEAQLEEMNSIALKSGDSRRILASVGLSNKFKPNYKTDVLNSVSQKSGSFISKNILARDNKMQTEYAEDLIGRLISTAREKSKTLESIVLEIRDSGYLGILRELVPNRCSFLILDVQANEHVFCFSGSVSMRTVRLGSQIRKALSILSESGKTKQELVSSLWGYNYKKELHDPILYALFHRIRSLFKETNLLKTIKGKTLCTAHVIQASQFSENRNEKKSIETTSIGKQLLLGIAPQKDGIFELNFRQRALVAQKTHELLSGISVLQYSLWFEVTTMTALRDLKQLVDGNILKRIGKGKATRYIQSTFASLTIDSNC
jgi:hypothetical protein